MPKSRFENLEIYNLSERLEDLIWKLVLQWEYFAKDTIGKQIVDASDSVGANIAEGSGKGSDLEFKRYCKIARGSLFETKHWLRRAYKRQPRIRRAFGHGRPAAGRSENRHPAVP